MKAVQAPIQTSMALTYETCGVSAFRPEKKPSENDVWNISLFMSCIVEILSFLFTVDNICSLNFNNSGFLNYFRVLLNSRSEYNYELSVLYSTYTKVYNKLHFSFPSRQLWLALDFYFFTMNKKKKQFYFIHHIKGKTIFFSYSENCPNSSKYFLSSSDSERPFYKRMVGELGEW